MKTLIYFYSVLQIFRENTGSFFSFYKNFEYLVSVQSVHTLRIRIKAHMRQFILRKKFSLYQLSWDLSMRLKKNEILQKILIFYLNLLILCLKLLKYFVPTLQFGPTLLIIFQNQSPYALIQGYTTIRIVRVSYDMQYYVPS